MHARHMDEDKTSVVPKFKTRPKDDLERHTFYATPASVKELKYWALIDDRGQSEILREALDIWLKQRRREM